MLCFLYSTAKTAEEMQDTLRAMNVSAKVTVTRVESGTTTTPIINTYTKKLDASELPSSEWEGTQTYSEEVGQREVKAWRDVPSISMDGSEPGKPAITYVGSGKSSPKATKPKGGGGSKKKKSKSDTERYHEIKKTIDTLTHQYDELDEAKNRAFG